ncbi:MAG: autotransporter-associated beta strand repeat-containing protein [Cephaloticoccus sp.]|nr:autotransporter-associated beta strand repeat-containing protein [Cephaloticoccus sp.]
MHQRILLLLLCTGLFAPISQGQTTVIYDPDETDSTPHDTTGNPLTLSVVSGSATQSGALSGTGNVTKSGAGTLTLTGTHAYTGDTYVNGGSLGIDGVNGAISDTTRIYVGFSSDGTLSITNGGEVTPSSFVELGHSSGVTGTLNIEGANSQLTTGYYLDVGFDGNGTLNITNGGSLTTSSFARLGVNATGVGTGLVSGTGSEFNVAAQLELGTYGNGTLTIADGGTVTAQALHFDRLVTGSGTLNLNDGGTLVITSSGGIENYGTTGDATLNLSGGTLQAASTSWSTTVAATLTNNTTVNTNGVSIALNGDLSGTGGLAKIGAGTLTLGGTNIYDGGTSVTGGLIEFSALSALGTGTITLDGGGLRWGSGTATDVSARLTAIGAGGGTFDTNGNNVTLATGLTGTGAVTKQGNGVLSFTGTNSYEGGTTVTGGLIEFSALGDFGTGNVTLNGGGLRWASSITTDISSRLTAIGSAGGTFDTNGNDVILATGITSTGNLTKQGVGALTLSGTNTLTNVAINGGSLDLTSGATINASGWISFADASGSSGSGNITDATLNTGTTLYLGYNGASTLTIGSGGTVTAATLDLAATANGNATLNLDTGGILQVGGTEGITAGNGTVALNLSGGTIKLTSSDFTTYVGATLTGTTTINTNGLNGGFYGPLSGNGGFTKHGSGILTVTNSNTYSGTVTVDAGTLLVNTAPDLGTGNGDVTVNAGAALAAATSLEFARNISVNGTDAVIVSPNHLEVGSAGDGAMTISNGGLVGSGTTTTLAYYGSDTGTIDVTGTNSFLYAQTALRVGYGGTGTLSIGSGGTANARNLIIAAQSGSNGTINLNTGGTLKVGGTDGIAGGDGTGTFNFAGGTLKVGGDARVSAAPASDSIDLTNLPTEIGNVIADNTPQVGDTGLTTSVAMTLTHASTIDTNGSAASLSGILSGTGSLTKAGDGTLTLANANTYSGTTSVNAGTLVVNGSLANTAVTIADGATLGGSGSIAGLTTIGSGATLAPGNFPGTITFSAGLTFDAGAILDFQLGTVSDLIAVTGGTLTGPSSGTVTLNLSDSGGFGAGTYTLFDYTSATLSDFDVADFALGSTIAGYDYSFNLTGSALQLVAATSAVPEPSTYAAIFGALALGLTACRKRRK